MQDVGKSKPTGAHGYPVSSAINEQSGKESTSGIIKTGTGEFLNSTASTVTPTKTANGSDAYTMNLVDAPVASAAKKILGDIMGFNYVIDPKVTGTITLQTASPVSREGLMEILEVSLASNGAAIVKRDGRFDIVPMAEAAASSSIRTSARASLAEPGTKIEVVSLKYISADEMSGILDQVSKKGAVLRKDSSRNYLVVAGTGPELSSIREAIAVFDTDWMKGMSVALYPLKASQPGDIMKELNSIFGADAGPNSKSIKFIPNRRLNAILAITSRPSDLQKVSAWISKLDRTVPTNDEQLFVYQIQNRPAAELAKVLQNVLASGSTSGSSSEKVSAVAPDLTAETATSEEGVATLEASVEETTKTTTVIPYVVADVENNALLISTTAREYRRIEQVLRQLDILPTQVFLEAIIAEVTLNDQLKFGMRWYLEHKGDGFGLSDLESGAVTAAFPGFSWTHVAGSAQAALSALSTVTNVKVISSPNLMVINNQKATLQVGDQVPTITQTSANNTTGNAAIISSVELKDTGIILAVTPRINSSGRIMLDIQQEVSNVVETTTSGIDSPTIQQRKISTRVMINDGESLALGGLIQEKKSINKKKAPVIGDIPLFGNAFKAKTDSISRTELIIFIRPRIVRDVEEARQITDEFRQLFESRNQETPGKTMKRDLVRLAN